MMAVKHNMKSTNAKIAVKAAAPETAGGGGHVHKVLEAAQHMALGGLVKIDGYVHQEKAQDEVVNVQV
jgi:hypothetical protein